MAALQALTFCPDWLVADGDAGVPHSMRAFGTCAEDLSVQFEAASRPDLITELLERCCCSEGDERVDRQLLLKMPVGMRIEALVTLATLTDDAPLSWQVRCTAEACGGEIEFDLSLAQIVALAGETRALETCESEIGGERVTLRRATGADQMDWSAQPASERSSSMLRSIVVAPSIDALVSSGVTVESLEAEVDHVMDRFDPLVGFHLRVACPDCGEVADVSPDLTALALERLSHAQQALISEVHVLASRYHWSERDVLEMPRWRRERYLELVEGEG